MRRIVLLWILFLAACSASPTPERIEHAPRPGTVVLQVDSALAFLPPRGRQIPDLRLYGDGFVLFSSPDDGRLMTGHLDDAAIQVLLREALVSGFFDLDDRYTELSPGLDARRTRIFVNLADRSKTVTVIGDGPEPFQRLYERLRAVRPERAEPFRPESGMLLASVVARLADSPDGALQGVVAWPEELGVSLAESQIGTVLEGETYRRVEDFVVRHPPYQVYREGHWLHRVQLLPDLPREN